ncbi:surface protein [Bifidobacterium commune]|nr:surface protein [Bifidobacterium commune]
MQYAVPFASELPEHAVATKSSDKETDSMQRADANDGPKEPCPTNRNTAVWWNGVYWRITNDGNDVCTLRLSGGTITGDIQTNDNVNIPWKSSQLRRSITAIEIEGDLTIKPSRGNYLFSNCTYLKTFTATQGFHLRGQQYSLFAWDVSLEHIYGMKNWDTTGTTSMESMFGSCHSLASVDVSNFDTSQVTTISQMFADCPKMTSVDVSKFDTSNVTEMYGVFHGSGFVKLDLSTFKTKKVTRMDALVYGCKDLTSINVENFDTREATNMSIMFARCPKLTVLNLWYFDTTEAMKHQRDPSIPADLQVGVEQMLPSGLKMLRLGDYTNLNASAFAEVPQDRDWVRADSMDDNYKVLSKVGKTSDLVAIASAKDRDGIYRSDKPIIKIDLTIQWANGQPPTKDTATTGQPYKVPSLNGRQNPKGKLFSKWVSSTNQFKGNLVPEGMITFDDNIANPNVTLTASWETLEKPTVKVVHTVAPQRKTPTVDLQSSASKSPKNNDEIRVWSTTGSPQQAKFDQTYTFNESENPHKWTSVNAGSISPKPGAQYELHTTEARVDPYTGNKVTSDEGITKATLPYTTVTYSNRGSTSGNPPAPVEVYTETDVYGKLEKGKITLPLLASESAGGMKNSKGVLWGWHLEPDWPWPDPYMRVPQGDYGVVTNDKNTDTNGHTDITLYPVWRTPLLPDLNGANFKINTDGTITMDGIRPNGFKRDFENEDMMVLDNDGNQWPTTLWKPVNIDTGRWSATSRQPVAPGKHKITATVTVLDHWREGGTPSDPIKVVYTTSIEKTIADNGVSSVPLTGGMPQKLAIMIAAGFAVALMLVAAVRFLRNKRQEHAR